MTVLLFCIQIVVAGDKKESRSVENAQEAQIVLQIIQTALKVRLKKKKNSSVLKWGILPSTSLLCVQPTRELRFMGDFQPERASRLQNFFQVNLKLHCYNLSQVAGSLLFMASSGIPWGHDLPGMIQNTIISVNWMMRWVLLHVISVWHWLLWYWNNQPVQTTGQTHQRNTQQSSHITGTNL